MARLRFLLATSALVAVSALARPAHAINVGDDAGLRAAIFAANTGGDAAINFTGNITLAQSLPMITSNVTITGNGFTLDAANLGRAIFVASGSVNVSNLTIANARAQGGAGGGSDSGGGGGGLGAGAAVFVYTGASLTLSLVQVRNAASAGGAGGAGGGGGLSGGIRISW